MTGSLEDCVVYNNTLFVPSNDQEYNGMHVKVNNMIELICPDARIGGNYNDSLKVGVRFTIPVGLYIDVYELRRRHNWNIRSKSNKIPIGAIKVSNYTYNSTMNSEVIAEHFNQSTELFIEFTLTSIENQFNFQYSIPMHLRYHLPSYSGRYKHVSLLSPVVSVSDKDTCHSSIGNSITLSVPVGNMNDHVYVYSSSLIYYVSTVLIVLYAICRSL